MGYAVRRQQKEESEFPIWLFLAVGIFPGIILVLWLALTGGRPQLGESNDQLLARSAYLNEQQNNINVPPTSQENPPRPEGVLESFYEEIDTYQKEDEKGNTNIIEPTEIAKAEPPQEKSSPEVKAVKPEPKPEIVKEKPVVKEKKEPVKVEKPKPVEKPKRYIVQAGSFESYQQADGMRAQLILLGISAKLHKVTINNTVKHRVRVGPLTNEAELKKIQKRLQSNGIQFTVLKVSS